MKKFIALIAVAALMLGLRLSDNGLLWIGGGSLSVFGERGAVSYIDEASLPMLDRYGGYTRLDTVGEEADVLLALKSLNAVLLWTEQIEGITIYYAYSHGINKFENVCGKRVNIMAALSSGNISYGCPLLKGSY